MTGHIVVLLLAVVAVGAMVVVETVIDALR